MRAVGPWIRVDIAPARIDHRRAEIDVAFARHPNRVDIGEVFGQRDPSGDLLFDSAVPLQGAGIPELRSHVARSKIREAREIFIRLRRIEDRQIRQRCRREVHAGILKRILNRIWICRRVVERERKSLLRIAAIEQDRLREETHVCRRKKESASGTYDGSARVAHVPCKTEPRCDHLLVIGNRRRERKAVLRRCRIEVIRIELGFIPQARADRQSRQGAPLILDVDSEFVNREIQSACSGELLIRTGISREQCIDVVERVRSVERLVVRSVAGEPLEIETHRGGVSAAHDGKIVDELISIVRRFESNVAPRTGRRRSIHTNVRNRDLRAGGAVASRPQFP